MRTTIVAAMLIGSLAAECAHADSFMSSPKLDAGVPDKRLPGDVRRRLTASQMLVVMQWKGLDAKSYSLGGIESPVDSLAARSWIADRRATLDPRRTFLAAYKAMWAAGERARGALIGEMHRAKASLVRERPDPACEAAMAIGIALVTLDRRYESLAGVAALAEAIALARAPGVGNPDRIALRAALRSTLDYGTNEREILTRFVAPALAAWVADGGPSRSPIDVAWTNLAAWPGIGGPDLLDRHIPDIPRAELRVEKALVRLDDRGNMALLVHVGWRVGVALVRSDLSIADVRGFSAKSGFTIVHRAGPIVVLNRQPGTGICVKSPTRLGVREGRLEFDWLRGKTKEQLLRSLSIESSR